MSLFFVGSDEKVKDIARKVFDKQFQLDPKLETEYDARRKNLMYSDILYNMEFLHTSVALDEDSIFIDYSMWIYQLLCNLMKDLPRERIKEQMITHYKILGDILADILSGEALENYRHHLDNAIRITEIEANYIIDSSRFEEGIYFEQRKKYLEFLIQTKTKAAIDLIELEMKSGIGLQDIYIKILQETMVEVGNLWQRHEITVDKEHYCSAVTQGIMSQFYPMIFNSPRNGYKLLACCVGSELHELGIRMLADLFEYAGWDSIYLGAAVPTDAILHAIDENKPNLIALSVTMPHHLLMCRDLIDQIRHHHPNIKIVVG